MSYTELHWVLCQAMTFTTQEILRNQTTYIQPERVDFIKGKLL